MNRPKTDNARQTFAKRASGYDAETGWVTNLELLEPLVPFRREFAANVSGRFLDICTGTGQVASLARSRDWNVVAVDQSKEMLENTDMGSILAVQADAENLPFLEKSFDVCAMRQALHYFNPEVMIRQMIQISRSEIRLGHITTHHADDLELWSKYFRTASPGRRHVFIPGQIARLVRNLGAEAVEETVLYSKERFDGPIEHLGSTVVEEIREKFLGGESAVVERYVVDDRNKSELIVNLRWEFHVFQVPIG